MFYLYLKRSVILLAILLLAQCCDSLEGKEKTRSKPKSDHKDEVGVAETVIYRHQYFDVLIVDPAEYQIELYLDNDEGRKLKNFKNLKHYLAKKSQKLIFATNAGMYKSDNTPQGLYVEDAQERTPLVLSNGKGNFFMKPNGVFLLNQNTAHVIKSEAYKKQSQVVFATQSGPLLVYNDSIHHAFNEGSNNLHIRSGVGVDDNGNVIFAISKKRVNFYDFAMLFKEKYQCKNALYLDGFVSKMYLPTLNRLDSTGNFGAMFAISSKQ